MRLLLLEALTAGWYGDAHALVKEGLTMWRAALTDCLDASYHVTTLIAASLVDHVVASPKLQLLVATSAQEIEQRWSDLTSGSDAAWIIAPEENQLLERLVASSRCPCWNATPVAIRRCADKFFLAQWCHRHGIPVIPTWLGHDFPWSTCSVEDLVLKPRYGAGCRDTRRGSAAEIRSQLISYSDPHEWVIQPWIEGQSFSTALIAGEGEVPWMGSPCWQHIICKVGGWLEYAGGLAPAVLPISCRERVQHFMVRIVESIPGLWGWVGFDWLLPSGSHEPLLCEINPRLTTSYVAHRVLSPEPLVPLIAGCFLPSSPGDETYDIASFTAFSSEEEVTDNKKAITVTFTADGEVLVHSPLCDSDVTLIRASVHNASHRSDDQSS
ncbi:MAG: hypothetical protein KatS3mg113_0788 [Planctomycetaceae bacterium]|nr:MAG: hypothetical protein KatS3mg113_0788 [Planctomycetaceae bacterium]